MAIFNIKHHTTNTATFYNDDQSITGEVRTTSNPDYNSYTVDDEETMVLTQEMEDELDAVQFPYYHTYVAKDKKY